MEMRKYSSVVLAALLAFGVGYSNCVHAMEGATTNPSLGKDGDSLDTGKGQEEVVASSDLSDVAPGSSVGTSKEKINNVASGDSVQDTSSASPSSSNDGSAKKDFNVSACMAAAGVAVCNMNRGFTPALAATAYQFAGKSLLEKIPFAPKHRDRLLGAIAGGLWNSAFYTLWKSYSSTSDVRINGLKLLGAHAALDLVTKYGHDLVVGSEEFQQENDEDSENETGSLVVDTASWAFKTAAVQVALTYGPGLFSSSTK